VRLVLVISIKTTMEKTGYDVRNVSDGRTHFMLVWRKIWFVSLVRHKHCFVLSFYPLYLLFYFLYFVTILCAIFVNYSPTQIRNMCAPNLGIRSFFETNFARIFLFIIYDVYVETVSSLIK
jgi:hypothetical protein